MITILPVFREEGWHSMDLCGDMLLKNAITQVQIRLNIPKYRKLLGFLPFKSAKNFDRWFNRWQVYPNYLRKISGHPGFFHIVDHSYAHLVNYLPKDRTGVYCHDLDAFKCILHPNLEPRPEWFKNLMVKVFDGFKKAAFVFCNTQATRNAVLGLGIWKAADVVHAPLGVADEFSPKGEKEGGQFLLHVGSCIARKRIDVLINAFSHLCKKNDKLKLIQAGGTFSQEQLLLIKNLRLEKRIEQRQNLSRENLARLYRGAKCLVLTSDAEGFGLPVIEGLSCGTRVVATDIPAIREVGGCEVQLFPVGDSIKCAEVVLEVLQKPAQMSDFIYNKYSWASHAKIICDFYKSIGK